MRGTPPIMLWFCSTRRGGPMWPPADRPGTGPYDPTGRFPHFVGAAHRAAQKRPDGGIGPYKRTRVLPDSTCRGGCPHPPADPPPHNLSPASPKGALSTNRSSTQRSPDTQRQRAQFLPPGGNGDERTQGELARKAKRRWPGPLASFWAPRKKLAAGAAKPHPTNETALSSPPHPALRATFPPGGRLKSRRRRKPLRFKNQLSCRSCFSSASRFSASMGDKMFTSVIRSF